MNLLIIEDSEEIRSSLEESFKSQGYAVDGAPNGTAGLYKARVSEYDLVVLDLGLPDKNGREVCRDIRAAGKTMPIIILSVQSEIESKTDLLALGADDYLVKPFSFTELAARVKACLRRPRQLRENVLRVGDIVLDSSARNVEVGERPVHLTPKEFFLLEYLMKHRGRVVARQELLEHVWGAEVDLFTNTIETHIANLRRKIRHRKDFISTVSSGGYKIA